MRGRLTQLLFIATCVAVVWLGWSSWSGALPQYKNEALTIPTLLLYLVALPTSVAVQLIYMLLALFTPIDRIDAGTGFLNWLFKTWVPLTVAGYLQWFVFLPRLVRYLRGQRADSSV